MIYTNRGTSVKVIGGNADLGFIVISRNDVPGQDTVSFADLKADGGIHEIIDAIEAIKTPNPPPAHRGGNP